MIHFLLAYGLLGVFLAMVGESLGLPLVPSEVVLPFAGWMVARGRADFAFVLLLVVVAQLVGSAIGYGIGRVGGRPLLRALGRVTRRDELALSEAWFRHYGPATVFWGRFFPVVRTFVSWPAGLSRMRWVPFLTLTFFGSIPWSAALIFVGVRLGTSWQSAGKPVQAVGWGVALLLLLLILYLVARRLQGRAQQAP